MEQSPLDYASCTLCPRMCRANRSEGAQGFCGADSRMVISSAFPHHGEESVLSGSNGSGTVFFCGCNLKCVFCQNYEISHTIEHGRSCSPEKLAGILLGMQEQGCHNVNFVTPTHFVPSIINALKQARSQGLTVPAVYNCGGYENPDVLAGLEPFIDIYMPDIKFFDRERSRMFLGAPDYPEAVKKAVSVMDKQKGPLEITNSIAVRGVLIRHLVMPGGYEDSRNIIDFIAEELSPGTFVNIMGQYRPCGEAVSFKDISGYPDQADVEALREYASERGLRVSD